MKRIPLIFALAALAFALGCRNVKYAAQWEQERNDLKEIALTYNNFTNKEGRPPADADQFIKWVSAKQPEAMKAVSKIQSGRLYVRWGVNPSKAPAGTANTILGWQARTPTNGGFAVMADGSTRDMTSNEFNDLLRSNTLGK